MWILLSYDPPEQGLHKMQNNKTSLVHLPAFALPIPEKPFTVQNDSFALTCRSYIYLTIGQLQ